MPFSPLLIPPHSLSQDESDNDDEMDYDGSTQELLANVDCLLTTDGGNGSQVRWGDVEVQWMMVTGVSKTSQKIEDFSSKINYDMLH